jgi:hypothetical protein
MQWSIPLYHALFRKSTKTSKYFKEEKSKLLRAVKIKGDLFRAWKTAKIG